MTGVLSCRRQRVRGKSDRRGCPAEHGPRRVAHRHRRSPQPISDFAGALGEFVPETSRPSASRAAFRSANLNATREQLLLLAPASIVRAADETFKGLRKLRDLVGQGHGLESPDYQQILNRHQLTLKTLRNGMREDLGTPSLDDDVIF